jgi:hypothetical protein
MAIKKLSQVLFLANVLIVFYLAYWFISNSYTIEAHPRLKKDTVVLSQFIDPQLTKESLLKIASEKLGNETIKEYTNWSSWDGNKYPHAIKVGGITYFFDDSNTIAKVDHWYKENSPLWVK